MNERDTENLIAIAEALEMLAPKPTRRQPMEYKIEDTAARLLALGRITEAPSDETVRRWCREGRFLNAYKKEDTRGQGGSWRIPETDLLRFQKPRPGPMGPRIRKGDSDV